MSDVLLWHFPISHFNEKVRWALDLKRIPHRRRTLGPAYVFQAWRKTGRGTLPIIFLDGRAIGDSTRIIAALEERVPDPALYPSDASARQRALALEDWLDEELGPAIRAAVLGPLFGSDPAAAIAVVTTGMPIAVARTATRIAGAFRAFYLFRHRIEPGRAAVYRGTVYAALERIARELDGREYLVGERFSVADLTAAALLAPVLQPPELQYRPPQPFPPEFAEYRDALLDHPACRWAIEMFRRHRGTSAEIP